MQFNYGTTSTKVLATGASPCGGARGLCVMEADAEL